MPHFEVRAEVAKNLVEVARECSRTLEDLDQLLDVLTRKQIFSFNRDPISDKRSCGVDGFKGGGCFMKGHS